MNDTQTVQSWYKWDCDPAAGECILFECNNRLGRLRKQDGEWCWISNGRAETPADLREILRKMEELQPEPQPADEPESGLPERYDWTLVGQCAPYHELTITTDTGEAIVLVRVSDSTHNAESVRRMSPAAWNAVNDKLAELEAASKQTDLEKLREAAEDATPEGCKWGVEGSGQRILYGPGNTGSIGSLFDDEWSGPIDDNEILAAARAQIALLEAEEEAKCATE